MTTPRTWPTFWRKPDFSTCTNVFTEDEMAQVSSDMDTATPLYQPDDGRSWWARTGQR